MKKPLTRMVIYLIALMLSACRSAFLAADQLPWVGDEPVLFREDFSGENLGWATHEDTLSYAGFDLGGYRLQSDMPDYQFWSVPGLNFEDTIVQVRAKKLAGPDDNLFGLVCRYQDDQNFYALMIGSDSYYGIYKRVAGEQSLIDQVHMDFSDAILPGVEDNIIQAVCQGSQLSMTVNDIPLITVQDDSLTHGDVGLILGTFDEPGVDVLFDDFIVIVP